jgi:hypothetical protein
MRRLLEADLPDRAFAASVELCSTLCLLAENFWPTYVGLRATLLPHFPSS